MLELMKLVRTITTTTIPAQTISTATFCYFLFCFLVTTLLHVVGQLAHVLYKYLPLYSFVVIYRIMRIQLNTCSLHFSLSLSRVEQHLTENIYVHVFGSPSPIKKNKENKFLFLENDMVNVRQVS